MTPTINSADTFAKLSEASRKWCVMVKPTRRRNSVLDSLTTLLDFDKDTTSFTDSIMYAFDLLSLDGYKPKMEYEDQL